MQQLWVIEVPIKLRSKIYTEENEDPSDYYKATSWFDCAFSNREDARRCLKGLKIDDPHIPYRLTKYYSARYLKKCWKEIN